MASRSLDGFVDIVLTDTSRIDADVEDGEIFISTVDIHGWDFPKILGYKTVKIRAHRSRLIQGSSYFHGLLCGSFSESGLNCISIHWNLETFLSVLRCIYGSPLDVKSDNFLPLFEGALYFGVEMLLCKCRTRFSELTSSKGPDPPQMELDDLIHIWKFGLEHANDFVPELCAGYLARNFMWAMTSKSFGDVPCSLLLLCLKHPHLTVDSEVHLSDALLVWLDANIKQLECLNDTQDDLVTLIEEVRGSLLPVWFATGKKKSRYFSKLADESIDSIFRLMKMSSTSLMNMLVDGCLTHLRIRLTEYSERLDLSGCPQVTAVILLLSLLPSSFPAESSWRRSTKNLLMSLEGGEKDQCQLPPTLSFKAVQEVDISKCTRLNLKAAIEFFSKSFPALRKLRANYLLNFKPTTLHKLVIKCPQLCEVNLTVDTTPIILGRVTVVSSTPSIMQPLLNVRNSLDSGRLIHCLSNITRLTMEGRNDLHDSDLQSISRLCDLHYLNIKGCSALTDVCISEIVQRCKRLHSILVCDTLFGRNSILALCTSICTGKEPMNSMASNLQTLYMGGCKGVDEASLLDLISQTQKLKSLCLRDTNVVDVSLCKFSGPYLEMLDVSNTKISRVALAHIRRGNPGLKCLKARGCTNLLQQESDTRRADSCSSLFGGDMVNGLGNRCGLEELEMGWGFSYFDLESMRPAIRSLRAISVGLGGSLGEAGLKLLPVACPLLESIILHFQVVSDYALTDIIVSLKRLAELALCYCFGDISISSFKFSMPNLKKLRLERMTHWMTNDDLFVLAENCPNLIELSLVGCVHLNSDSQQIISSGWPGLISLHLEDCGGVTANGVSSLFDCVGLEDLLLRHNGPGIERNFILVATSKLPMLRLISLDMCDAREGDFDVPDYEDRCFLSSLKLARCKSQRCAFGLGFKTSPVHKQTLVMAWSSTNLSRTVVKERL